MKTTEKWMSGIFLLGLCASLWGQPLSTYGWVWNEVRDTAHEFAVGLLDISSSYFSSEWKVVKGGNQAIDLSRMIPGDERQLHAVLSNGDSDLDLIYKVVAEIKGSPETVEKLENVLRIRVESGGTLYYDGPVRDLTPLGQGAKEQQNPTEGRMSADDPDKPFDIAIYLPSEGVDSSYQGLSAQVEIRFLARQATPGAIYAE